jgi:hypothetical protein
MASKIYQLQYDDKIDKDIDEWLKSLPRSRKAEMVRNAIRFYLHATNGSPTPIIPIAPATVVAPNESPAPKRNKKRPSLLPTDGDFSAE